MDDQENMSVVEETSEAVAQATESQSAPNASDERSRNDAAYNWAEARRSMQERDRQIQELQNQVNRLSQPPEKDELENLAKDDILNVDTAQKLIRREAAKIAAQVIKQREASTVDERLQSKFPDYREVVTPENIELLKRNKPAVARTLAKMADDPFDQCVEAYEWIKQMSPSKSTSLEKERAIKNAQKPVSINAATKSSAIGDVHIFENGLTPELKAQMWKELQEAKKRG